MLQFLHSVEQLTLLDTADEASATVRAPAFAPHLAKFNAIRFDALAWAKELREVTNQARRVYTTRDMGEDTYEDEARQVRDVAAAFVVWVRKLHAAARAIEVTDHPNAGSVARLFKVSSFDGSSTKSIYGHGPTLVQSARKLGDLSSVGLTPAFLDEGEALLRSVSPEREDAFFANVQALSSSDELRELLNQIVQLMERYGRFREFAMAMSESEIPEIGLAQVRAALAGRGAPPAAVPAVSAPVPSPGLT